MVAELHGRVSAFVKRLVAYRRSTGITVWRNWVREDPLVHPYKWLRADMVPPSPFLQCSRALTPGGSGILAHPAGIDAEFRKAWLPYFCRSEQRETNLHEFNDECVGWLPHLDEFFLPALTGDMLFEVVRRKSATAGSLDGWGWRELKVLPVAWFDSLARILTKVEDLGVWPDGLMDAYITMIPKTDGDAAPLDQRPLSVLPVGVGGVGFVRTLWSGLIGGCVLTWCRLPPFSSVSLAFLLVGLVSWLILPGLMKNSVKLGFPTVVVLGKGKPAWGSLMRKLTVGCLYCLRLSCLP